MRRFAPIALVIVLSAVWLIATHRIDHRYLTFSDGVYTYIATRVAVDGPGVLYDRIALSQPPTVVLLAAGVWKLAPHIEALRALLALLSLATAVLTFAVARACWLAPRWAVAASTLALVAPIQAQFSGLDGEALMTPLMLGMLLLVLQDRPRWAALAAAVGLAIKLTWLPLAIAALWSTSRGRDQRSLDRVVAIFAVTGAAVFAAWWAVGFDVVDNVRDQSGIGSQPGLAAGMVFAALLLWAPLLPLAGAGVDSLPVAARALLVATIASAAFTIKSGTVFNVLLPAEPMVAIAVAAGARELLARRRALPALLVTACGVGIALHTVTLAVPAAREAVPFPIGAAYATEATERNVDDAVSVIRSASDPDDLVFLNPMLAVAAGRRLVDDQADWFIVAARDARCANCHDWSRLKRDAYEHASVVGIDSNVTLFDPSIRRVARDRQCVRWIDATPMNLELFARGRNACTVGMPMSDWLVQCRGDALRRSGLRKFSVVSVTLLDRLCTRRYYGLGASVPHIAWYTLMVVVRQRPETDCAYHELRNEQPSIWTRDLAEQLRGTGNDCRSGLGSFCIDPPTPHEPGILGGAIHTCDDARRS